MEFSRRHILSACAACSALTYFPVSLHAQDEGTGEDTEEEDVLSVCTTDESASQGGFNIADFSAQEESEVRASLEEFSITDYGTAFLSQRWRRGDGLTPNTGVITLGCFFMSGRPAQQELVKSSAQGWLRDGIERVIRFDFTASQENSQIRIMIGGPGNNSTVGRDALGVKKSNQTMNLMNINRGTIQHEFGHALGMQHEHMHPNFTGQFDENAVISDMKRFPANWSEAKTRRNILNRFGTGAQCVGDQNFNSNSIMMYNIPSGWTTNRQSFRRANTIQDRDIACIRGLYGVRT